MNNRWIQFIQENPSNRNNNKKSIVDEFKKFHAMKNTNSYKTQPKKENVSEKSTEKPIDGSLSTLSRDENKPHDTTPPEDDNVSLSENDTIFTMWYSKSHKSFEKKKKNDESMDFADLIKSKDGNLFLRYRINGKKDEFVKVESISEAKSIIEEDNFTTTELYPKNRELLWALAYDKSK